MSRNFFQHLLFDLLNESVKILQAVISLYMMSPQAVVISCNDIAPVISRKGPRITGITAQGDNFKVVPAIGKGKILYFFIKMLPDNSAGRDHLREKPSSRLFLLFSR